MGARITARIRSSFSNSNPEHRLPPAANEATDTDHDMEEGTKALHKLVKTWLDQSRLVIRETGAPLEGDRLLTTFGMLHISMEHQDAMEQLIKGERYFSAAALLRPTIEALLRGLWLSRCATDEQIKALLADGKEPPGYLHIANAIIGAEPAYGRLRGFLDAAVPQEVKHDFTHGGRIQLEASLAQLTSDAGYVPFYTHTLLQHIALYRFFTCVEMLHLIKSETASKKLRASFSEFESEAVNYPVNGTPR